MRTLCFEITPELNGRSVKWLLRNKLHLASSLISRVKLRESGILLNGKRARTIDLVRAGDTLSVEIGDAGSGESRALSSQKPDIIYEDEDILVINKNAGVAVHGGEGGTVVEALSAYLQTDTVHIITRLDKGTSGLLVAAKNAYMTERLRRVLHTNDFRREYLALATGAVEPSSGTIDLPIAKAEGSYKRFISQSGSQAVTKYETLAAGDGLSLLRLQLLTGRTHQIRLHLSALGAPILGDWMYGEISPLISRCALHSERVFLRQPLTGESLELSAPLPSDMSSLAEKLIKFT